MSTFGALNWVGESGEPLVGAELSVDPGRAGCPLYRSEVAAGFPSPADDYVERSLDLNAYLIRKPAATFHVRVSGESMAGAGILAGDILVVDRSVEAADGHIVIAVVAGELTVKRLYWRGGVVELRAENRAYAPLRIGEGEELQIWGVVIGVVRKY